MDFSLNEDQQMLVETVKSFTKKDSPVERLRQMRDSAIGWDKKVWQQMGELGWLGVPFPEEFGGIGGSVQDACLIIEQLGKTLVPEPYVPSVLVAGLTLLHYGSKSQKEQYLPPMIEGKTSLALATTEQGSRFDVTTVRTRAEKTASGYKLSGQKVWVINGQAADQLLISARTAGEATDPKGVSLFIVDSDAEGLQRQTVNCMDSHKAAFIELRGVEVPVDARLGDEDGGAVALERAHDFGAIGSCSEGSGIMQAVLKMTRDYLCEREQFGVKIGTFQALQHRLVDMFVETELAKSTAILAMIAADYAEEVQRKRAVSAAKAQLIKGGYYVTQQGIQLHGGIGCTDEHDVGLFFKRMHTLAALYGDRAYHTERFASLSSFTENV